MGPLSIPNAVGIILAHGNAGSALNRNVDVWMTRDGGYTWNKVGSSEDQVSFAAFDWSRHAALYCESELRDGTK